MYDSFRKVCCALFLTAPLQAKLACQLGLNSRLHQPGTFNQQIEENKTNKSHLIPSFFTPFLSFNPGQEAFP